MTFIFGKLVWAVTQPGNLLLLCLLVGVFLLLRGRRRGELLVVLSAIGLLLLSVAPIGPAMLLALEQRFPRPATLPEKIDGIVVLGGIALARRYPEAKLALVGGEGGFLPLGFAESRATLGFVVDEGIAPARVVIEEKSRSTHENAVYAKEIVRPGAGAKWVLVTSAYHMPRAVATFRAAGWPLIPYPVDYKIDPETGLRPNFSLLDGLSAATLAGKEWAGLFAYRVMGWTRELFPAPAIQPPAS